MLRTLPIPALCLLTACGGGGGGGGGPPASLPVRLTAAPLTLASGASAGQLELALASTTDTPVLVQFALVLPSALAVAATDALAPAQPLPTLDGERKDDRYVVVCGDARNRSAEPLRSGPLCTVQLQATSPRRPGTYTVLVRDLLAARSDGSAAPVETAPLAVRVAID